MADVGSRARPQGVSLDELAAEPGRASALPADIAEALLGRCIAVQSALYGRLLAARAGGAALDPAPPRFIDAKAAAARLQVPVSWLYDQARQGKLPSVRLGHYVRFRPEDLERFIAEREQGA